MSLRVYDRRPKSDGVSDQVALKGPTLPRFGGEGLFIYEKTVETLQ